MKRTKLLLPFFLFFISCSAALPEKDLEEDVQRSAKQSRLNSEKSEVFLKEAQDNLAEAKKLLQDGKVSLEKAQLASKQCLDAQKKIVASKKRAAAKKKESVEVSASGYSPSDAPLPESKK